MQQSILQDFPEAVIHVSIVWIEMLPADAKDAAQKMANTIRDPRVTHYYEPRTTHFAGKAFAHDLVKVGPAWDIYLFYDKDAVWNDYPPSPADWWHQLGGDDRADPKRFQGGKLAERLHVSMHDVTGAKCRKE